MQHLHVKFEVALFLVQVVRFQTMGIRSVNNKYLNVAVFHFCAYVKTGVNLHSVGLTTESTNKYIPKIHLNIILQFMPSCPGSIYPLSILPKSLKFFPVFH